MGTLALNKAILGKRFILDWSTTLLPQTCSQETVADLFRLLLHNQIFSPIKNTEEKLQISSKIGANCGKLAFHNNSLD